MGNIAIAHDQFYTYGGAERVAVEAARHFDAPIYVMRGRHEKVPDDVEVIELSSKVGGLLMERSHTVQDAYQMLAWQTQSELYDYDIVLQTKCNPYWFVPRDDQTVVRYTHSTPRNLYDLWSRRERSLGEAGLATIKRMLYQQVVPYADAWAANSDVVKHRMTKYFAGVEPGDVEVVYPPVDVASYRPTWRDTGDYVLSIGRLAHNKRLEVLMEAAELIDRPVKVAGEGPEREDLEEMAPGNVEFLGYVSEDMKRELLSGAMATVFVAENEDFGMVPVESMASGTPVVGVDEGFTSEQIVGGKSGLFCRPEAGALAEAIRAVEENEYELWGAAEMKRWAEQFSRERFLEKLSDIVWSAATGTEEATSMDPDLAEAAGEQP